MYLHRRYSVPQTEIHPSLSQTRMNLSLLHPHSRQTSRILALVRLKNSLLRLRASPEPQKRCSTGCPPTKVRVDSEPGQVSMPKLVSASTSVDTIPIRSGSVALGQSFAVQNQSSTSSKSETRFNKFRGHLGAKPDVSYLHRLMRPNLLDSSSVLPPLGPL